MQLGRTDQERRTKYRKLFREYLDEYNPNSSEIYKKAFIGDEVWILETTGNIKKGSVQIVGNLKSSDVGGVNPINDSE